MKRKRTYIIFALICILIGCVYRYYYINKDVPRKHFVDSYKVGETIDLGDTDLTVESVKRVSPEEENADGIQSFDLKVKLKNKKNQETDITALLYNKLKQENFIAQVNDVMQGREKIKSKKLQASEECEFILRYSFPDTIDGVKHSYTNKFELYISRLLYKEQVDDKLKDLKLYGKAVEIGGGIN